MSKYESQDSLKSKKLVVVFTHTNYTLISGGTEKFLREYVAILRKNDIVDITIFPITHRGKSSLYYAVGFGECQYIPDSRSCRFA